MITALTLNPDQLTAMSEMMDFVQKKTETSKGKEEAEDQQESEVRVDPNRAFFENMYGLYGYAGSGKSTLLAVTLGTVPFRDKRVVVTAPTHKAVGVIHEMLEQRGLSHVDAHTLHALLNIKPVVDEKTGTRKFQPSEEGGIRISGYDVVIVDECSMVGTEMYNWIRQAQEHCGFKVIFVGDPGQLPPVKEEELNKGKSKTFIATQFTLLKHIERCSGSLEELVTQVRTSIGTCKDPVFENSGQMRRYTSKEEFLQAYLKYSDQAKIVAHTNATVNKMNKWVRDQLFGEDAAEFTPGERLQANSTTKPIKAQEEFVVVEAQRTNHPTYHLPCWRVICHRANDQEKKDVVVYQLGEDDTHDFHVMCAKFKKKCIKREAKWHTYYSLLDAFPDLRSGYAQTVHASQGSTYRDVFIVERDLKSLKKTPNYYGKMLYVAYSRASFAVHVL